MNTPHHIRNARPSARRRPAFTLIEMLVVIAIIVILLGIGMAVGPAVLGKGDEMRTRATLQAAQVLLDQYLDVTGQSAADAFNGVSSGDGVSHLITKAKTIKKLEKLFSAFDEQTLRKDGTKYVLSDGWDNPIHLKWADGKEPSGGDLPDEDQPYFASAGPDGKWGKVNGSTTEKQQLEDNEYSFKPNG